MALAQYFHRSAVAAAQVIGGYDEEAIRQRLDTVIVALAIGQDAVASPEGLAFIDLTLRLLSRLYPRIGIRVPGTVDSTQWRALALQVNPEIEVTDASPTFIIAVGADPPVEPGVPIIYAGSHGWDGRISSRTSQSVGDSSNPFGPGIAACLACANAFRFIFVEDARLDDEVVVSARATSRESSHEPTLDDIDLGDIALVGAGAVGNAALWALGRTPSTGTLHLVDHESIELSNMQRYVLTSIDDVGTPKVDLVSLPSLSSHAYPVDWATFVAERQILPERVLVAVDTAQVRRDVQAALPKWIANAWTQPGDLGVSVHPSFGAGACVRCLYLPKGGVASEDKIIAEALGFNDPQIDQALRGALYLNAPLPEHLHAAVAQNLGLPIEDVERYRTRPLRELYREGICGGALLPLDRLGSVRSDVHVPLAHQSALAGVLLAATLFTSALGEDPESTMALRLNVMQPVGEYLTQPVAQDPRGICICQDADYRQAYAAKFGPA